MATVPPIDAAPSPSGQASAARDESRLNGIEIRLLDAGAKAKENLNREADQRYYLRWLAVGVVIAIIVGMGTLLKHVVHRFPGHQGTSTPASYVVAVYVAPIVSITTLTLSLLVAAFRGFKDGDEKAGMSAVAESAKAAGLGNS